MLIFFKVINFRNLFMEQGMYLGKGANLIYGKCASGKTNFCIAITDFFSEEHEGSIVDKVAHFYYTFQFSQYEIIISYDRSNRYGINNMKIEIPLITFIHQAKEKVKRPCDIFLEVPFCVLNKDVNG